MGGKMGDGDGKIMFLRSIKTEKSNLQAFCVV